VLGRGGTGVVYEAYDAKNGSVVALKTIESSNAESLYRLKREFRALADVHHENLVRFDELSFEEGQWFFTMELVRGTNFVEYVRPGAGTALIHDSGRLGSKLDEARLSSTLPQLVAAIAAIHDAGHVHRDIKASNVLVSNEGRVVLLDFGLVTALRAAGAETPQAAGIVGTPAFMAPEQAEGNAVGPAADWYAFGVVLFLALTGRLPFEGSTGEVLEAKLTRAAPPVRDFAPDAPANLASLCADLLRDAPAERPSVDAIRARLGLASSGSTLAAASATTTEPAGPFVGRAREHAALVSAFAAVRERGERRIVVVEGEPGVGKSALVQRFLASIEERAIVLVGRCYEQESMPLKGVDGIVDALSDHLVTRSEEELGPILAGGVRYVAAVFPVLRRVPSIATAVGDDDRVDNETALRSLAFGELERLLGGIARDARPLVVFLDDLQWADADSIALLERLFLAPAHHPLLFVATARVDPAREVSALVGAAERIAVSGLAEDESRTLLDALLPAQAVSAETRAWAMHEAAGHPFFLAELARSGRAGKLEAGTTAPLLDVLWDRVQGRDLIEQRFLEMVALAGAPTPYEILAAAAGIDVGDCLTRLGTLRAAQLVRITRRADERLIEPYHDRVREAIAGHVAAEGPRALAERHLRLGRALRDGARGDAPPGRVFTIVQHLHAARDLLEPHELVDLAALRLVASTKARLTTAYDAARVHAAEGLALLGPDGWTKERALARDLSIARLEAEYLAGNRDAALGVFESIRARVTDVDDRAALAIAWIGLETSHGRCVEAIATGREVLRQLRAPLPARVSILHVLLQHFANRRAQRKRSADDLVALEPLRDRTLASVMRILVSLAPAAFFLDTNLVTWILLRIAGLSFEHGVCDVSSYGFVGYGSVLAGAFHQHAEGYAFGRAALALNDRFKNDALAAKIENVFGGYIAHWTRPFRESAALLRAAYDRATRTGDTSYEVYSATVLSLVNFGESRDLASVQSLGEWAREVGQRREDRDMSIEADIHARYAMALRGLTANPRELGVEGSSDAELRASLSDEVTPTSMFHYHYCRAELAYLFGDASAALHHLREAAKRKQVTFSVPASVDLVFMEALVAAARFGAASWFARPALVFGVAARARKLARWAASCPMNYEPHFLIARAEEARIRGRAREATARFDEAIASARTRGAPKREAIALELAMAHARRTGDEARARSLQGEAAAAYRRWGAVAKERTLGGHDAQT
jgi:predicted ATPase